MRVYREDIERLVDSKLNGSFLWMFVGLAITFAMVFLIIPNSFTFFAPIYRVYNVLTIAFLLIIFAMALLINKLSSTALKLIFLGYSAFMGILLFPIIYSYQLNSVYGALAGSAVMFLVMALIGYTTKANLYSMGRYLMAALIGIIVLGLVNIFLKSTMLDTLLAIVGLIVFLGYTIYDVQRIKESVLQAYMYGDNQIVDKIQIIGALNLYMDFINILLRILQLTGRRD